MGTFADLMSLLMCFFVLMLSFSEMDVLKFEQIAGSMKYAFGVQNVLEVKDIPKGTSVMAQKFRPGRPEPTPIETIMQQTIDITEAKLDFQAGEIDRAGGQQKEVGTESDGQSDDTATKRSAQEELNQTVSDLAKKLLQEILDGGIELESPGQQIIIRLREKGAFPAGSAFLQPQFRPIIRKVADVLKDIPGEIIVSGHTDNEPFLSELYRSNWDLSSQRAVAVAHQMIKVPGFEAHRLIVRGLADTQPLVDNTSPESRRRSRRVEIAIWQGKPKESDPISKQ